MLDMMTEYGAIMLPAFFALKQESPVSFRALFVVPRIDHEFARLDYPLTL